MLAPNMTPFIKSTPVFGAMAQSAEFEHLLHQVSDATSTARLVRRFIVCTAPTRNHDYVRQKAGMLQLSPCRRYHRYGPGFCLFERAGIICRTPTRHDINRVAHVGGREDCLRASGVEGC